MITIQQLPVAVPSLADPVNFTPRADAIFTSLPVFIDQSNNQTNQVAELAVGVENDLTEVKNLKTDSDNKLSSAIINSNLAASATSAQLWVSGTTYSSGTVRSSPINAAPYRKISSSVGGALDPSLDSTNWKAVTLDLGSSLPKARPTLLIDFTVKSTIPKELTFSRTGSANYTSNESFINEQNLLSNSADILHSSWTRAGFATVTFGSSAPNNTPTANRIIWTAQAAGTVIVESLFSTGSTASKTYTASAWVKTTTGTASINIVSVQAGVAVTNSLVTVTTTWQKIFVTRNNTSTASSGQYFRISTGNTSAGDIIIAWPQLEEAVQSGPYVKTTGNPIINQMQKIKLAAVNEARIDYDPITKQSNGLYLEGASSGLWQNNKIGTAPTQQNMTVTANSALSPIGSYDADLCQPNTTSYQHNFLNTIAQPSAGNYVLSGYFKPAGTNVITMSIYNNGVEKYAYYNISTKTVITGINDGAGIIDVGGGWVRIWLRANVTSTASPAQLIAFCDNSNATSFAGDGYSGAYVWGIQYEKAESVSSLMPLSGSYGSRVADSCIYSPPAGFSINSSVYTEFKINENVTYNYIATFFENNNNCLVLRQPPSYLQAQVEVSQAGIQRSLLISNYTNSWNRCCFSFTRNGEATGLSTNGSPVQSTSASITPGTYSYIRLGGNNTNIYNLNGYIKKFIIYPVQLSSEEMISLSTQ